MVKTEAHGHFGQAFAAAIDKRGVSLRDLARETDHAYEHMRKLIRNAASPSTSLLKELCRILRLDYREMEALVTKDKMERKYGFDALHAATGKNPRLSKVETFINLMSEEKFELWLGMGKTWAQEDSRRVKKA